MGLLLRQPTQASLAGHTDKHLYTPVHTYINRFDVGKRIPYRIICFAMHWGIIEEGGGGFSTAKLSIPIQFVSIQCLLGKLDAYLD